MVLYFDVIPQTLGTVMVFAHIYLTLTFRIKIFFYFVIDFPASLLTLDPSL